MLLHFNRLHCSVNVTRALGTQRVHLTPPLFAIFIFIAVVWNWTPYLQDMPYLGLYTKHWRIRRKMCNLKFELLLSNENMKSKMEIFRPIVWDKKIMNYSLINPLNDMISNLPSDLLMFLLHWLNTSSEFWAGKINHCHSCNLRTVPIRP